jgi:signal transduction histidine kinase
VVYDIDQVIRQVRGYIDGTGPGAIAGKDLPRHAEELITSMAKDAGVAAEVAVDPDMAAQLTSEQVGHVLAMIREAVSNALQHAHASGVSVSVSRAGGAAVLRVEDDGCGFDPAAMRHQASRGLNNLRARAARLRGRAEIRSAPGRGTRVRLEFPMEVGCEVR